MAIIAFPSILNEKLTDAGTQALVDIFDKVEQQNQKATLLIAEERFEKRMTQLDVKIDSVRSDVQIVKSELEAKIDGVRSDVKSLKSELEAKIDVKIDSVRSDVKSLTSELEARIEAKTEKMHTDIIKWMFIFCVGQVGTITAIFFAFSKVR
ncbi:MAG: hypothetical protein ABH886_04180 [Candidatus Desantisbacteria bacterium]